MQNTCFVVIYELHAFMAGERGVHLASLVNTCTVAGTFIREVEAQRAAIGISVLDAPISGGVSGANAGPAQQLKFS